MDEYEPIDYSMVDEDEDEYEVDASLSEEENVNQPMEDEEEMMDAPSSTPTKISLKSSSIKSSPSSVFVSRPLRDGIVVRWLNDGELICQAPIHISQGQTRTTINNQTNAKGTLATTPMKRKASPSRDVSTPLDSSSMKKVKSEKIGNTLTAMTSSGIKIKLKKEKDDSVTSMSVEPSTPVAPLRTRLTKTPIGAALITPSPIPPVGTFVNVSDGYSAVVPEVPQFPYTGPLLKKAGAQSQATASAASSSSSSGAVTASDPKSGGSARAIQPVVMPSFAAWFDMNQIHEIERACQ